MKDLRNDIKPHILPNLTDWPIFQVYQKRKELLKEVENDVMDNFDRSTKNELDQILAKSIYLEKQRVKSNPFKVDPPNEMQFYRKLQKEYNEIHSNEQSSHKIRDSVFRLVKRYAEEIGGNFNINTFLFARRLLSHFFYIYFFKLNFKIFKSSNKKKIELSKKLLVKGELELVRDLMKDHTIILVPTHSSNLDSALMGYILDTVCGMPAFTYGAGLNLFDSEFFAFFMNRLGAYKLDRRKKNQIYLQTLSSYSKIVAKKGVHTIFFPGGTRSRSGDVETKLKLGLLGSMIAAQRELLQEESKRKIIIVPAVISYESVLEARSLITQHLKTTGQERYTARERISPISQYIGLIKRIATKETKVCFTLGRPLDVFGNIINSSGESVNHQLHSVDISLYFKRDGKYEFDAQRESVYTKELADYISQEYRRYNYILPAHLMAFTGFKLYSKLHSGLDLYSLVQLPEEEITLPIQSFKSLLQETINALKILIQKDQLISLDYVDKNLDELIGEGLDSLGVFHQKKALRYYQKDSLISEDFITLLFYSNKLSNLDLDSLIHWDRVLR